MVTLGVYFFSACPLNAPVYHCFTQHSPRWVCPRVAVSWGRVFTLISVLAIKIRAARNCTSQICQWLWVNRWSFCQFLAASLLIFHITSLLCFCKRGSWIVHWLVHNYGRFFFSPRVYLFNFNQRYRTSFCRAQKSFEQGNKGKMVGVENLYVVECMM